MDNYMYEKHEVREWLACNPKITVQVTPTSASWVNLAEVWLGIIERHAFRRGTLRDVRDLTTEFRAFINGWNARDQPCVWAKTAEQILEKANRPTLRTRTTSGSLVVKSTKHG